jgi:hypothetical protein
MPCKHAVNKTLGAKEMTRAQKIDLACAVADLHPVCRDVYSPAAVTHLRAGLWLALF